MSSGLERTRSLECEEVPGATARWNLAPAALYEEAIRRGEGMIAAEGPMVCRTGEHTGRSPKDKFLVREPATEKDIAWGAVNRPMDPADFARLHSDVLASLQRVGIVRPGLLRRRRSEIPSAHPRDHRIRVAQPVCPQPVHRRPRRRGGRVGRSAFHRDRLAELQGGPEASRHTLRSRSSRSVSPIGWPSSPERAMPARSRNRCSPC